jgi:hypothetical protein
MKNSTPIRLLPAFLAVALMPMVCAAGTIVIPVTGSGQIEDNKFENSLVVSGSGFSFEGISAGSNGQYCGFNVPCSPDLQGDVFGMWSYNSYSGMADASIQVGGPPFMLSGNPCAPAVICNNVTAGPFPASFMVTILTGFGDSISGTITGIGTIDLTNGFAQYPSVVYFNNVDFGFDGNASLTITPEPGSIVLAGTGMLALLEAIRRKRRAKHCQ